MMSNLIDDEVRDLGTTERVYIGGFSQGGTAAIFSFLLYKGGRLGGCVSHSAAHLAIIDYEEEIDVELKR